MDVDPPHLATVAEQSLQGGLRRRNGCVTARRDKGRRIDPQGSRKFGDLVNVQYSKAWLLC